MKAFIKSITLVVMVFVFYSCEKGTLEVDNNDDNALLIKSANTIEGRCEYPIKSAFLGGGVARNGHSHRCRFYQNYYSAPDLNKVEALVEIYGFAYNGIDYMDYSLCIKNIVINGLDEAIGLGDHLSINMNQGNYEGDNTLIKDVQITSYKLSKNDSDINIIITAISGIIITIRYSNAPILWDGMRG